MFADSCGRFGLVRVVRASTAPPLPEVQKREPQRGPVLRIGSLVLAARPAAAKNPVDPAATTGILCAELAGTIAKASARHNSAANHLNLFINLSPLFLRWYRL